MQNLSMLIFLIPVLLIGGAFFIVFRRRDSLMDVEQAENALHREYCGGRFGRFNYSAPFVRFAMYESFLVASYIKKVKLDYDQIESFEDIKGVASAGLSVIPRKESGIDPFILWSQNRDQIKEILAQKIK